MKFPRQIYVTIEGEKADEWLSARKEIAGMDNGTKVAIYKLVEIKTLRVSEALE